MDYKPSHINQCNLSCAQNIQSKNHSFQPLTPSSKCRVPGARDHQWQRLRLSHTAWPIETRGRRNRPKKCDQCFEAQDYTKGGTSSNPPTPPYLPHPIENAQT